MTDERTASRQHMLDERRDLRRLFETLDGTQWDVRTLCGEWTVRDLLAHLVGWDDLLIYRTRGQHLRALGRFSGVYLRSLGNMGRFNEHVQSWNEGEPPAALLARFATDDGDDLQWLFDGSNANAHLAEYVIHHQDIRRPLGLEREIPPDRLVAALDGLTKLPDVRRSAGRRLKERRWEATDVDWSAGSGPTTEAPGETILMTLAGR